MIATYRKREEWLAQIPKGWKIDRLKDLAKIATGTTPSRSDSENYSDEGVPWIKPDALNGGVVSESKERLSDQGVSFSRLVPKGSVLVGCIGYLGKLAVAGCELCTNQQINSITFDSGKVDPQFGKYAIEMTKDDHLRLSTLVVVSIINKSRQGIIEIPRPPFPEQKKIAAYLDASCSLIDRTLEKKQKQLVNLDLLYKSIITPVILKGIKPKKLFRKTLNTHLSQIPEDWKLVSLKRISEIKGGLTLGKTYEGSLVMKPYLRAANVQDGYLDLKEVSEIEIPEQLSQKYELQYEDILMTEGGDLDKLGRGYIWEGQIEGCLHQNHVFAISTNQRLLLPKFLMYLTASQFGRDYFESTGKRTTNLASTNSTKLGLLPIPLPPIYEQREIVNYIENNLKQVQKINESIVKQINKILNFRKSLIHECVTGMRSITDTDIAKVKAHV